MINYQFEPLFREETTHKEILIVSQKNIMLTNENLHADKFKFVENLTAEQNIRFGSCEASYIQFTTENSFDDLGEFVEVYIELNDNTPALRLGSFYIVDDKISEDKKTREITAFDRLYKILNTNYAEWYNSLSFPMSLKAFRNSFCAENFLEQEAATLVNDNITVKKTIEAEEISGRDILTAICEINGVFAHLDNNGKLKYVKLKEFERGLYPANDLYPANNLYPLEEPNQERIRRSTWKSCSAQSYEVQKISKLTIRQEEGDIGATVGSGNNEYVVDNNFICFGKSADQLQTIADNMFNAIKDIVYTPCKVVAMGNYCRELGDNLSVNIEGGAVNTYLLRRTIEGIQCLFETIEATGDRIRPEETNTINSSIIQLQGRTNKLKRTVDETVSEINKEPGGLKSLIKQNAESITAEVKRAKTAEGELSSAIALTAENIKAEVIAKKGGTSTSFSWELTANDFTLKASNKEVMKVNKDGLTVTGSGKFTGTITATAGKIGNCTIADGVLNVPAANITGTLKVEQLDASVITTANFQTQKVLTSQLQADVITTANFTAQKITGGMIDAGSIAASKLTAGTVNGYAVKWQRFEYMTGLNWSPLYRSGAYLTDRDNGTQPVGYMVTSIRTDHLYSLCQTNA